MKTETIGKAVLLWAVVLSLLLTAGCAFDPTQWLPIGTQEPAGGTTAPSDGFDHAGYDWLALLEKEAFAGEEALAQMVEGAVGLQVGATTASTVTVKVTAPNVTEALMQWYDEQTSFSGEAMEEQIRQLLKGKKTETSFTLSYVLVEGEPVITYPEGYANALSCGLTAFYDTLYERILEQMGGTENE